MEMYLVEAHRSDAARMHGQNIRAVKIRNGRKYITVSSGRNELKFNVEKETDVDYLPPHARDFSRELGGTN